MRNLLVTSETQMLRVELQIIRRTENIISKVRITCLQEIIFTGNTTCIQVVFTGNITTCIQVVLPVNINTTCIFTGNIYRYTGSIT
jgi:hypothetical protein